MKKQWFALFLLLITGFLLQAAEKSIYIGRCRWYTEQNDFAEIVKMATREKKPILVFYSATWCGPCQQTKWNLLSRDDFKRVENEAVLVFIEQTEKMGAEYVEKHKIKFFPTIKLFSSDGIEMDSDSPGETVDSVLDWMAWVKKRALWLDRLANDPTDWDALFRATYNRQKLLESSDQYEPNMALLRRSLRAASKRDTANRHKAQERLIEYLYLTLLSKKGPRATNYAQKYKKEFTRLLRAYYPDKFYYSLKTQNTLAMWVEWLTTATDYRGAIRVFERSSPFKQKVIDIEEHIRLLEDIIVAYLNLGYENKANAWFKRIEAGFKTNSKTSTSTSLPFSYARILLFMVDHYFIKGKTETTRKYSDKLLDFLRIVRYRLHGATLYKSFTELEKIIEFFHHHKMTAEINKAAEILQGIINSFDDDSSREIVTIRLAKKFGLFVERALILVDEKQKVYGGNNIYLSVTRAVLLARKGERKKAVQLITIEYDKIKKNNRIDNTSRARMLNSLAWALVEMDAGDEKIGLEIAEKSVHFNRNNYNLDTLATIYAEQGKYKEAIKLGREALNLAKWEKDQVEIEEKLETWQKRAK